MNPEITCKKTIAMFETYCTTIRPPFGPHDKDKIDFMNGEDTTRTHHCAQLLQIIMGNCIGIVDYHSSNKK